MAAQRGVMSLLSSGATLLDRDQDVIRAAGDHVSTSAPTELFSSGASWPLHPFLFGAAAVFSLYAANLRETTFGDVGAALGGVLVFALILLLGFWCGPASARPTRRDPCQHRARRGTPLRGPHPLAEPVHRCGAS